MRVARLIVAIVSIGLSGIVAGCASHTLDDPVADIFRSEGIIGTFVAASVDGTTVHAYNEARAEQPFSPASTFKIPNTLIALDAGVVESASSAFAWDGVDRGLARWNKDQTLETAFKVSCVWCYQRIARQIGRDHYESALAALNFGNQMVGERVDLFWLDDSLQISALEQIDFLRRLYNYEVAYRREHVDLLRDIMLAEETTQYTIYAKTGWAQTEPQVAWYVGFVESENGVWLFALNMQVDTPGQPALRQKLAMDSLRALGII